MALVLAGRLATGELVVVDTERSMFLSMVSTEHLKPALAHIDSDDLYSSYTPVDFEQVIGVSLVVPITDSDKTTYVHRKCKSFPSKVVFDREPEPTSLLTVGLRREEFEGVVVYVCFDCYYGDYAPCEPDNPYCSPDEIEESILFWREHAFGWNPDSFDFGPGVVSGGSKGAGTKPPKHHHVHPSGQRPKPKPTRRH